MPLSGRSHITMTMSLKIMMMSLMVKVLQTANIFT